MQGDEALASDLHWTGSGDDFHQVSGSYRDGKMITASFSGMNHTTSTWLHPEFTPNRQQIFEDTRLSFFIEIY